MTPSSGTRPMLPVVLVVAAALALTACAGPDAPSAARPGATASGPLLAFSATTLDGAPFDGASLAGKPTVLWFWAPWCSTCLQQAPGVRAAVDKYGDSVNIVGVAGLDSVEAMPEFVRLAKVGAMTHLADEPGVVWRRFQVSAQSIFVLLDRDGNLVFRGQLSSDEVPERVAALLT